jgi:hypothetical protein
MVDDQNARTQSENIGNILSADDFYCPKQLRVHIETFLTSEFTVLHTSYQPYNRTT